MDYSKKRPFWQWFVIYLIIGVLVYGVVYYLYLNRSITPSSPTVPTGQITPDQTRAEISISSTGFVPSSVSVKVGGTVTWNNLGTNISNVSSAPHPTHTDYPPLNLGDINPGASVSLTFPTAGTYYFHNHLDSSQFGSITVQ